MKESPHRIFTEFDIKSGKNLVKITDLRDPPTRFGLILGDCLHNFRAALDNLVYELAEAYSGSPLPDDVARGSEFLIYIYAAQFQEVKKRKLGGIAPGAQTIIEGLQPYRRRNDPAVKDLLWQLNLLNNIDKHRLPHVTPIIPKSFSLFLLDPGGATDFRPYWGHPIENGAVIADYTPSLYSYSEMDMTNLPALDIAFGQRSQVELHGWPVVPTLKGLRNYIVRRVIPPLIRYLA